VKTKRYAVRERRTCHFFKGLTIQHQQERRISVRVVDRRQHHAIIFARAAGTRGEPGFAGVIIFDKPDFGITVSHIDFSELIGKIGA